MKKLLIEKWKPLSALPALLLLAVIFSFSAQTGEESGGLSYAVSLSIVTLRDTLLGLHAGAEELARQANTIHILVRKAAHMTEYCLLCWSVSLPFFVYRVRAKLRLPLTLAVCVLAAALDEFHQSFVSGRVASPRDVAIDSLGALIGLSLLLLARLLLRRRRQRAKSQ